MIIPRPELSLLERALDEVIADGKGKTIFVTGEPGIGKSTLIDSFFMECDHRYQENILTATGRCIDIDGISRGYLPWKEILIELDADRAAGKDIEKKQSFKAIIKTIFDESGSEWIQNIPFVGDISAAILDTAKATKRVETVDVLSGEADELSFRQRLIHVAKECTGSWMGAIPVVGGLAEAIYKTSKTLGEKRYGNSIRNQEDFFILLMTRLRKLAKENPIVVFLDDLQWADASSLSLLLYLSKNLHDLPYPLLLIGSYRPEDVRRGRNNPQTGKLDRHPLEEKVNVLMRYDACREIALGAFSRAQLEAYLLQRFPHQNFTPQFIDELEHVCGGNALFVQEMLTNMIERGMIAERDGVWELVTHPDYSKLPQTVEGVIKERYERLAEDLKEMLQVAAVEGDEFSFEVLESILQENRLALNQRIDSLMNKHALVHRSGKLSEKVMRLYEFTHNLVQKYIYYSMGIEFRREIHRMIAGTLKELLSEDALSKWAEEYSLHLGVGEGIIDEHRHITLNALPVKPREIDAIEEYMRLQEILVDQHSTTFNNEEAIAGCDHLIALMQIIGGDGTEKMTYLSKKVRLLALIGRWVEAEELYRQQLITLRERGDRAGEAHVLTSLADLVRRLGRGDEAEQLFREGESIAREIEDRTALAHAVGYRGLLHWRRGEHDQALECYREQEEIAQELGDLFSYGMALGNRGSLYADIGKFEEAISCYNESEKIASECDDPLGVANAVGNRGVIYLDRGEYDKALASFQQEEEIERKAGFRRGIAGAVGNRGTVHLMRKEYSQALECFLQAAREHREIGFRYGLTSWLSELANTLIEIVITEKEMPPYLPEYVSGIEAGRDRSDNNRDDTRENRWQQLTLVAARNYASECLAISEEIAKRSTTFKSHLFLARIAMIEGEIEVAKEALQEMLVEKEDEEEEAKLHYWLWKVSEETAEQQIHATTSLKLYTKLYEEIPILEFQQRIEELRGGL